MKVIDNEVIETSNCCQFECIATSAEQLKISKQNEKSRSDPQSREGDTHMLKREENTQNKEESTEERICTFFV